jgi:hypothetical protein
VISRPRAGHKIVTTQPSRVEGILCTAKHGYTVTDIGNCSLNCRAILMVSTGPSWPTFNIWNADKIQNRIIILEHERLGLGPNEVYASDVAGAREQLQKTGWL